MPMALAQSHCTEAARAAALASHSAASLAAAAGLREAARLLRSSEALARAAVAALLALPRPVAPAPGAGDGAVGGGVKGKMKRAKKKKGKQAVMEGVDGGPELPPPAGGVPEVAPPATSALAVPPVVAELAPSRPARVLAPRSSRERSPRGVRALASASPSSSPSQVPTSASAATFAEGQAVVLGDLVSRPDLTGKCGVVKFFDSTSSRYAVCIDASGEMVKVLDKNLRASLFACSRPG
ncbi:unnamed protein product [Prorocentrum cordatum]|uniref:Uncharacterized protein n=1 Tax=Prorocentrum cordatum TaxID=2364126 RepID=A0ABN9YCB3_9DINO|nr:unnamed protein product [Polarella glacialis]|mmetsp:Transcript_101186/g.263844  ORF Transcript_101186/g.263844 Transcript_101186/m.263844 type:complete len:239 (-) Transcript_101186:117-833(-)